MNKATKSQLNYIMSDLKPNTNYNDIKEYLDIENASIVIQVMMIDKLIAEKLLNRIIEINKK